MPKLTPTMVLFPPGAETGVASLDWATGVIRIFMRHEEWARLIGADPASLGDELSGYESITHEAAHRLQLITTGFAYEMSCEWFWAVAAVARDCADLDAAYARRAEYSLAIQPLLESLFRQGPDRVSPISIMEGAAFYSQITSHRKIRGPNDGYLGIGPRQFGEILNSEAPGEAYRIAYDVACEHLGEEAFDKFPHVASLALFTREPETVFVPLLEEFQSGASRLDHFANHRMGISFLKQEYGDLFIGDADEVAATGQSHPLLDQDREKVRQLAAEGKFHPVTVLARGEVYSTELAVALQGPTMFRPAEEGLEEVAPMLWAGRDQTESPANPLIEPGTIRMLAAMSQLLLQDSNPMPDREAESRFTVYSGAAPGIITWRFAAADRTEGVVENLAATLDRVALDSDKARSMRGAVAIVFPAGEFPGSEAPLLDVEVQEFLRLLFRRIPYLLYYMIDDPNNSVFWECIAAFAPDAISMNASGQLEAAWEPRMTRIIGTLMKNAMAFAASQGQSGSVVLDKLRRLPPQAQYDVAKYLMSLCQLLCCNAWPRPGSCNAIRES